MIETIYLPPFLLEDRVLRYLNYYLSCWEVDSGKVSVTKLSTQLTE